MPGANPLTEGGFGPPVAAEPAVGYEAPAESGGPAHSTSFPSIGINGAGFTSIDNTSSHVAVLVVGAALVIALLYFGGFAFGVDAGVFRR